MSEVKPTFVVTSNDVLTYLHFKNRPVTLAEIFVDKPEWKGQSWMGIQELNIWTLFMLHPDVMRQFQSLIKAREVVMLDFGNDAGSEYALRQMKIDIPMAAAGLVKYPRPVWYPIMLATIEVVRIMGMGGLVGPKQIFDIPKALEKAGVKDTRENGNPSINLSELH